MKETRSLHRAHSCQRVRFYFRQIHQQFETSRYENRILFFYCSNARGDIGGFLDSLGVNHHEQHILIQNSITNCFFFVFIILINFCISDVFAVYNPAAVPTLFGVRLAPPPAAVTPPADPTLFGDPLVRPSVRSTTAPAPTTAPSLPDLLHPLRPQSTPGMFPPLFPAPMAALFSAPAES